MNDTASLPTKCRRPDRRDRDFVLDDFDKWEVIHVVIPHVFVLSRLQKIVMSGIGIDVGAANSGTTRVYYQLRRYPIERVAITLEDI